jgi:Tol biopolymer transport system component
VRQIAIIWMTGASASHTKRCYDDAAWTPDGKLIATGKLTDPGLFEIDPATKNVKPIDAKVIAPFQPSVSPDGQTIAFITGGRVWLIGRDGKNLRQLFQDGRSQQRPVFSPDGTKIAAVICNQLANDVTGEVFVIDLKTHEITPLRTNTGLPLVPDTTTRLNWIR